MSALIKKINVWDSLKVSKCATLKLYKTPGWSDACRNEANVSTLVDFINKTKH